MHAARYMLGDCGSWLVFGILTLLSNLLVAHLWPRSRINCTAAIGYAFNGNTSTPHHHGGISIVREWLEQVSNLATSMVALPEGAIWADYGITEQEAVDAAAVIHLQVAITQDGSGQVRNWRSPMRWPRLDSR